MSEIYSVLGSSWVFKNSDEKCSIEKDTYCAGKQFTLVGYDWTGFVVLRCETCMLEHRVTLEHMSSEYDQVLI